MILRFSALLCLILLSTPALAQSPCASTPKVATANYPGVKAVASSNNLLRPTGKPLDAAGQRLIVIGRVLDKDCMPLPGVTVELWQADPFGSWSLADARERATPDPVFAGAGRSYTNGEGHFSFITAFPGAIKNRAPFINIRVVPDRGPNFSTSFYFEGDQRNAGDEVLKKYKPEQVKRLMLSMQPVSSDPRDGHFATVDIVLGNTDSPLRY